jgi:autotransporter-associated beta strand protein
MKLHTATLHTAKLHAAKLHTTGSALLVICISSLIALAQASAQITSTWNLGASTDWFAAANWNNGVPNAPGDFAMLNNATATPRTAALTSPVTLGQLRIQSAGTFTMGTSNALTFNNPGANSALLQTVSSPTVNISNPIAIDAAELLRVDIGSGTTTLSSGFTSAAGSVQKEGFGTLALTGGSATWAGAFTMNAGTVHANHANALGSNAGATTINGGTLRVNQATSEPFVMAGGTLNTTVAFTPLTGQLTMSGTGTGFISGAFSIEGGTTGTGHLRITTQTGAATAVRTNPLNHQGTVTIVAGGAAPQTVEFDVDNGYLGSTQITGVNLIVRTAGGLGSAAAATSITNGGLRLHGASPESVSLSASTLTLWGSGPTVQSSGNYSLASSSTLTNYEDFGAQEYVVNGSVTITGNGNKIATQRGALTIAGGLLGSGNLVLEPDNDPSNPININSAISSNIALEVRSGYVRFRHANAYSKDILLGNAGSVVVEAPQQMQRIRGATYTPAASEFGNVEVAEGSTLTAERVDILEGLLRGSIQPAAGIGFYGVIGNRTISHLQTSSPVQLRAGELKIDDTLPARTPTNASIVLGRQRETSVLIAPRSTTNAELFLNNGSGFNFGGAIITENDGFGGFATIRGNIHLGANGAHIGGEDYLRAEGQIDGGDLNLGRAGRYPGFNIAGATAAYTGATRVFTGELLMSDNGRLANTSGIDVYSGGALRVDNRAADGPVSDRIADALVVNLAGGELSAWPTGWGQNTQERVGHVNLQRGISSLFGTHYSKNSLQANANLVIESITREAGAIFSVSATLGRSSSAFINNESPGSLQIDVFLENAPAVVNGILPAWTISGASFTTRDAQGRVAGYQGPTVQLDLAGPTSIAHVPSGAPPLAADKTVHALAGSGSSAPINLGGRTLTVGSGGISGAVLSNGVILPGGYANGELVFFGGVTNNATIADNGAPTSVVYSGDVVLGGNSTYTGKTYVVGIPGDTVEVKKASALPTGGDLQINGLTSVSLNDPGSSVQYQLGRVAIRDGGRLLGQASNKVSATQVDLEAGILSVALVGNFPIAKTTEGLVGMGNVSPDYTGRIDVFEGTLQAGDRDGLGDGYLTFGKGTVNVGPQGRLILAPLESSKTTSAPSPTIRLDGGALLGASSPNSNKINFRGTIDVIGNSSIYTLDGTAVGPEVTEIKIDGQVKVAAGKSLAVIGRPDLSRGLTVTGGIQLAAGSQLGGTSVLTANVAIAAGAILSPGLIGEPDSVGLLATSTAPAANTTTWGSTGVYRWEINTAAGDAGAPFGIGWDLFRVGNLLTINSTSASPFIIQPVGLTPGGAPGLVDGLMPNFHHRFLIAEIGQVNSVTATISGFAANKFAFDVSALQAFYPAIEADDFWLDIDSRGIHLNALFVPEPPPAVYLLPLSVAVALVVRWRPARRSRHLSSTPALTSDVQFEGLYRSCHPSTPAP